MILPEGLVVPVRFFEYACFVLTGGCGCYYSNPMSDALHDFFCRCVIIISLFINFVGVSTFILFINMIERSHQIGPWIVKATESHILNTLGSEREVYAILCKYNSAI